MKQCCRCKRLLDESEFNKDKYKKDGLMYHCKECERKNQKKRYKKRDIVKCKHCKEEITHDLCQLLDDRIISYHLQCYNKYKDMKWCWNCKKFHDKSEFGKGSRKDGLRCLCKDCQREYQREQQKNNREEVNKRQRKWVKNNPEKISEQNSRIRSMGFIPLWDNPFPPEIKIHNHHLNSKPGLVIQLPEKVHNKGKRKHHHDNCLKWIKKIYDIDIEELFEMKTQKTTIDDWL